MILFRPSAESLDRLMFFVTANENATYEDALAWAEHTGYAVTPNAWRTVHRRLGRTPTPAPKVERRRRVLAEPEPPAPRLPSGGHVLRLDADPETLAEAVRRINAGARAGLVYADGRWVLEIEPRSRVPF